MPAKLATLLTLTSRQMISQADIARTSKLALRPRFITALALTGLVAASAPSFSGGSGQLEVHLIDVGQGLAVYVESPTGGNMLIDGGNPLDGSSIIAPYLQSIGVTGLDYGVMTHWHLDHYGGLDETYNAGFKPSIAAYDRGDNQMPFGTQVNQYLASVSGVRATPSLGQIIDLGGGALVEVVSINGQTPSGTVSISGSAQEENARSVGLIVRYGDFEYYVGGDITSGGNGTANVEGPVATAVGQVEVVVPGHHGSNTSSSSTVVNAFDPNMVIYPAGEDNPFGHPTETVAKRWSSVGATRVHWCTTPGDTSTGNGGFVVTESSIKIETDGVTFTATSVGDGETVRFATFENPGIQVGFGDLAISEVMVNPMDTMDVHGEWFEIYNRSGVELDLGDMRITAGSQTFTVASHILMAPEERIVVGADGRQSRNGSVFLDLSGPWDSFALPNGGGSVVLRTPSGAAIDTVTWGGSNLVIKDGISAERIDLLGGGNAANFADAQTAWAGGDFGSPGEAGDNESELCPIPIPYGVGKLTSIGTQPTALWSGDPDFVTDDFSVVMVGGVPIKPGLGFYGFGSASLPFFNHTLYVQPPLIRMPVQLTDGFGEMSYQVPIDSSMLGTTRFYQFWLRDNGQTDGTGIALSSGVEVTFCPVAGNPDGILGDVIITEFMKDPEFIGDNNGEWIELYNATNQAIDMEGWTLRDDGGESHMIDAGGNGVVVGAGQYFVLGINGNQIFNGGIPVDYDYGGFSLDQNFDEIILEDGSGTTVNAVLYNPTWPSTPGSSNQVRAGILDGIQNQDVTNWCDAPNNVPGSTDKGTPGTANVLCP